MAKKLTELEPKEILDNLHMYISKTGLVLKEDKRKLADEKMTLILNDGLISELLEKHKADFKKQNKNSDPDEKKAFEEIELVLLKFYYAIYNDNVDLYRKFLNEKVSLGTSVFDNKLYLLNKELSNIFKNHKEYFDFIKVCNPAIRRFYASIGNKDTQRRDEYIEAFSKIIKSDKRYLYRKKSDQPPIYMNLLIARNIKVFGDDFLKNATYKQKEVINSFNYKISDELLEKVKFLIKKYPNYVIKCELCEEFLSQFKIDEIASMPTNQTLLLNRAAKVGIVPQVLEVFKIKQDFTCPEKMINEKAFSEIPADTMVLLSDNAKKDISKLKINEDYRKNVNKIVNKDLHNLKDIIKKKLANRQKKEKKQKPKTTRKK